MNNEKYLEKALENAGWKTGDAADFLEMSEEERQILEIRVQLAGAIRAMREEQEISQKELAKRLNSTQPRVARIEIAASDVSIDQLCRAFVAVGGKIVVPGPTIPIPSTKGTSRRPRKAAPEAPRTPLRKLSLVLS